MTIKEDEIARQLAARIKFERDARDWSLADLSAHSGVAKATISKIERGETSPTAVVLVRLASAFDLTFAGLLLRAEQGDEQIVRAHEQAVWQDPATGYLRRQVYARADHPVELVVVELPAGQHVQMPAASYAHIRQLVWVQSGQLVLDEGGQRRELASGDCIGFGAAADVRFSNETGVACTYVVALARS